MEIDSREIISLFVDKYGLTRGQVMAEIEKTFSAMLSRWHKKNVIALFTGNSLTANAYHRTHAEVFQIPVDLASMRGWNTIKRIIEKNLGRTACLEEVNLLKRREHQVLWGEIVKQNGKCLLVEMNIEFKRIIATCRFCHIGQHEREKMTIGQRRAFHLRRVDPIQVEDVFRTQVLVDRVSKNLVTGLLREKSGFAKRKIRCLKRYVGHKSFVETDRFIPGKHILAVGRELDEHIQVKVTR